MLQKLLEVLNLQSLSAKPDLKIVQNRDTPVSEIKPSCVIDIGGCILRINKDENLEQKITLSDGNICEFSSKDGLSRRTDGWLQIKTASELPIKVIEVNDLTALVIKTKGFVKVSAKEKINLPDRLVIETEKSIQICTPVKTNELWLKTGNYINFSKDLNTQTADLRAKKIFVASNITVARFLEAHCSVYRQSKNARLVVATVKNCISFMSLYVDTMILNGEITVGAESVYINVQNKMIVQGKIYADNLKIRAHTLYCKGASIIQGIKKTVFPNGKKSVINNEVKKLEIVADNLFVFGSIIALDATIRAKFLGVFLGGCIRGVDNLFVNALTSILGFGARLSGTNVTIMSGFNLNLFGMVRAYNYCTESIVNLDCGLTLPQMPNKMSDIINLQKAIAAIKTIAKNISAPFGKLLTILHKGYSVYKNADKILKKLLEHSDELSLKERFRGILSLDILNTVLAARSINFAISDIRAEEDFIRQCRTQGFSCMQSDPTNVGIAENIQPSMHAFLPLYLVDTSRNADYGLSVTGNKVVVHCPDREDTSNIRTLKPF